MVRILKRDSLFPQTLERNLDANLQHNTTAMQSTSTTHHSNQTMRMSPPLQHTPQSQSASSPSAVTAPSMSGGSNSSSNNTDLTSFDSTTQPMRNYDGTAMRDVESNIVYKSQFLSTHPLKTDCKERVGYAGKKFTYVSGDGVIRTMNAIFGHGGWSSQITMERNVLNEKDERGRWHVGYLASVRVTLLNNSNNSNGGATAFHEDCGSGEGIDNSKIKAHEKALKSAITDAMKRAARQYGERLGNALYVKGNGIRTAPRTNKDALMELERKDALNLFGDQAVLRANCESSNVQCKESPGRIVEQGPSSAVTTKNASAAAAAASNAVQKENRPQNRIVVGTTTATTAMANSFHSRSSPTDGTAAAARPPASSTCPATVLPSPTASSSSAAPHRGTAQSHGNDVGAWTGNPSSSSNSNNAHQSPNNISTSNRNFMMNAPQPPNLRAPPQRNGNPPLAFNNNNMYQPPNNNNSMMMNAHHPPNLMAPPPRPAYNPNSNGGAGQYNGGGNHHIHSGGRRILDATISHSGNGGHTTNANANGNNGGDSAKRQKVNPYSNKNKRMSV